MSAKSFVLLFALVYALAFALANAHPVPRTGVAGVLECGVSTTLSGDSVLYKWARVLEPSGMTYTECSGGVDWCGMQIPTGSGGNGAFGFIGGFTLSNLPSGSTAQFVIYVNGSPTNMVMNFTSNGAHDIGTVTFPTAYYANGTTSAVYFGVLPTGTNVDTTVTVHPPVGSHCYFNLQWNTDQTRREVAGAALPLATMTDNAYIPDAIFDSA
jgi:hypothetical protein